MENSSPLDTEFGLVGEAYIAARQSFLAGKVEYENIKALSWRKMETFLDLVVLVSTAIAREIRSAVLLRYPNQIFKDFTDKQLALIEVADRVDHCLVEPTAKQVEVRGAFNNLINNFLDQREYAEVERCRSSLPDEVPTAQCIIHQANQLNDTLENTLTHIVELKLKQYIMEINHTIFDLTPCLEKLMPGFVEGIKFKDYSNNYLQIFKTSVSEMLDSDKSKDVQHQNRFIAKWSNITENIKEGFK